MLHFQRSKADSFPSTIFNLKTGHFQLVNETNICNLNTLYPESLMLFRGILLCIRILAGPALGQGDLGRGLGPRGSGPHHFTVHFIDMGSSTLGLRIIYFDYRYTAKYIYILVPKLFIISRFSSVFKSGVHAAKALTRYWSNVQEWRQEKVKEESYRI